MKYAKIIGVVCILACLAVTGTLIFVLPDREISENENRVLTAKPSLTAEKIISTEFQTELDKYLSDQFPARDIFMTAGTEIKLFSGRRDLGNTYIGKDNYYFEKVLNSDIDEKRFRNNLKAVDNLAKKNPDIPFTTMLIPSSGVILNEKLPLFAQMYDAEKLYSIAENQMKYSNILNITSELKQHSSEYIYYRTDHHWTTYGAYIVYTALTGSITNYTENNVTDSFYGTLYSRTLSLSAKPDTISLPPVTDKLKATADGKDIKIFDKSALSEKDKYTVFFGGNYGIVDITGGSGKGTLLIIKDSFANCFAPFLLNDYEHIIMIDMRYYSGSVDMLLKSENINLVLVLYEMNNFASDTSISKLVM